MALENLKSPIVTNLDALNTGQVRDTTGENASGDVQIAFGYVTVSAAANAGSTYRLVRLPSNAKVRAVTFASEAQGAGKFQLSAYYSDSTIDGTQVSLQGIVVPTTGAGFFADDIDCAAAVGPTDKRLNTTSAGYTIGKWNLPLWSALGLASDPGGFIDVVAVVHTTAITTGTGKIAVEIEYAM